MAIELNEYLGSKAKITLNQKELEELKKLKKEKQEETEKEDE